MSLRRLPREWYDEEMYDPFGFDVFGYSRAGLDCDDRDLDGFDVEGLGESRPMLAKNATNRIQMRKVSVATATH